MMNFESLDS